MADELDVFLIERLRRSHAVSQSQVSSLLEWWRNNAEYNQNLIEFLVGHKVLQPAALKTLMLTKKGYLSFDDWGALMDPEGRRILAEQLQRTAPKEGERKHQHTEDDETAITVPQLSEEPKNVSTTQKTNNTLPRDSCTGDKENLRRKVQLGDILGKCLLTDVIGEGGSGVVFRALHKGLQVTVAVKVLHSAGDHNVTESYQRFRNEARLLARLDHESIVRVLDFEDDPGCPYLVQEYVDGPSLADLITQTQGLRPVRALEIVAQTVQALSAAWKVGVVHRDIKPRNILLTREGKVKVVDFGLAGVSESNSFQRLVVEPELAEGGVGTLFYMAPEQFSKEHKPDFRADIYSLGVTLFQALTGDVPFRGSTPGEIMVKHYREPPPFVHDVVPNVPKSVSRLVSNMLAKTPTGRFESYEALLRAIEATLDYVRKNVRPASGSSDCDSGRQRSSSASPHVCVVAPAQE